MKTTIEVVPFGGLGNRLRVLNSALFLGDEIGANVLLGWIVKAELNAEFNDLYKSATLPFGRIGRLKMFIFAKFLKHIFIQKYTGFYKFFLSFIYDLVIFDHEIKTWSEQRLLAEINGSGKVLIATLYQFWKFDDYNNFVLTDSLKNQVENKLMGFENMVGVHVRRTDHTDIIRSTSLNSYYDKMDQLLRASSTVKFFICSDDLEVKKDMKERYGENVIFNDIELTRTSSTGMEGAILDIYLLAQTTKIIANSKSSFAVMASKIGQLKEIIEV